MLRRLQSFLRSKTSPSAKAQAAVTVRGCKRMLFESMEPRVLMSADITGAAASAVAMDVSLKLDTRANQMVLVDNLHNGSEIRRINFNSPVPAAIMGTGGNDIFRIELDPNLLKANGVYFVGGNGDDTIIGPSGGTAWVLSAAGRGQAGNVGFWGVEHIVGSETARDTLTGPAAGATWKLDGAAGGALMNTTFSHFDHLIGARNAVDLFQVWPLGGSTAEGLLNTGKMSIEGGGGNTQDRIVVEGNHFLGVHVTRTAKGAGTVEVDGMKITHAGIENVHLGALDATQDVVKDYTFTGQEDDTLTMGDASDTTKVSVIGSDPGDTTTFDKPTGSLTIDAVGEAATVTLNSLTLHGIDLTVSAGNNGVRVFPSIDATARITVAANAIIDTSVTGGVAGDITLQAINIEIGANASIDAQGSSAGAFKLSADHRRVGTGFIIDQLDNAVTSRNATITIDSGAAIRAGSIDIEAKAGDWSLEGAMSDHADGVLDGVIKGFEQFQNFAGIPISVLVKRSLADIQINGATLVSRGAVSIDANAESDGIGSGTFFRAPDGSPGGIAFVYVQTDASATVGIGAGTTITANTDDINIRTEATTNASATARVSQNFGRGNSPTNPDNIQLAAAVGNTQLVSTIDISAGTVIQAISGDVNIAATGTNSNAPGAETESYKDGLAGFSLGLALSDTTVKVTSLGVVESTGVGMVSSAYLSFNPFTDIDAAADTIALDNTAGYRTGDALVYSSATGGAAQGLVDGKTYYVIVQGGLFQLALSHADAMDGIAIDLLPLPALENAAGQRIHFSQVEESTGRIVFDYNPGLSVGQKLYYDAVSGSHIGGLLAKDPSDPASVYTVVGIDKSTHGGQWLVRLQDAGGNAVRLNLDPMLVGASGDTYGFHLDGSAIVFNQAQPTFPTGKAFTYTQALGFDIPSLTDGATYYLVKDPADTTNTVFRLAASQNDATASDGFSNTLALDKIDTRLTSNDAHTLQAVNAGGVSITATLTTSDEASTKSGQGGEPETSDLAGKGEMLPVAGSILKNVGSLATLPKDQSGNLQNPMDDKIAANQPEGSGSSFDFGGVATVALVKSSNNVKVEIGGAVRSDAGITVDASITHTIQTQAEGVKAPAQGGKDGDKTATIAGAATIGLSYDNAQIVVDGTASLDAKDTIDMDATVTYPFITPMDNPKDFFTAIEDQFASNPLGSLSGLLGNFLLLKQDLVNSWSRAVDNNNNATASIAGAVDFQHRNSFATIDVMGGAQINQDADFRTDQQSLSLAAITDLKMVNIGGIFDYDMAPEGIIKAVRAGPENALQPYGAQGGKLGIGGAYRQLDLHSTTTATIHGANANGVATAVYTAPDGSLDVYATNKVFVLGVTQSGTSAGQFGISGSAAFNQQTTNTEAGIAAGAVVNAGSTTVDARDNSMLATFSGDVVKGKNLGFGASLVYNDINRTTNAYVGAATGASPVGADLNLRALFVNATTEGGYFGFALSAAKADNGSTPPGGTSTAPAPNPGNPVSGRPINADQSATTGSYGVAVSGDVVFNQVNDTTRAVINQSGTIATVEVVELTALDSTKLVALTGSAAMVAGNAGSGGSLGLAGAYSENRFNATTLAAASHDAGLLSITSGRPLTISATQTGLVTAIAAGGSGGQNRGGTSVEVAGSVAINVVTPSTTAELRGTTLNIAGDVSITATDSVPIYALAGAASFGGTQGYGAAAATNLTHFNGNSEAVVARIVDSSVNLSDHGTTLEVRASITNPPKVDRIVAVAGSLGQGGTVAVAGTVAVNDLGVSSGNAVDASIVGSNIVANNAGVVIDAQIDQTVLAVGGEVALSTGKNSTFALGAGVAYNQTELPVWAYANYSGISARSLEISASILGDTTATSAGLAVASNATGIAGSAAVNFGRDHVGAAIGAINDWQSIETSGNLSISATHDTHFTAGAGELAAGTNSGGAAVAINDVQTYTEAYLSQGFAGAFNLKSGGSVAVIAATTDRYTSVAVGADGGQNFTLGASAAVNEVNSVTLAYVNTSNAAGTVNIAAQGTVAVGAHTDLTFLTAAGTLAAVAGMDPGVGAVGLANATLIWSDTTQASVQNSAIQFGDAAALVVPQASGGALLDSPPGFNGLAVTAVSTDNITNASGGASLNFVEEIGGAGSASVAIIDKATHATVSGNVVLPSANAGNANVMAYDRTTIHSGAGALAGGSEVGVGAGVDVATLTKDTLALFAPQGTVVLSGTLSVQALSREDLLSVALGASLLNETAIAGAASAYVLDLSTQAAIGSADATDITAGGSVLVLAQDGTTINQFPGGLAIGSTTSVGASVGVVDIQRKEVDASVASHVRLTANADPAQAAILGATGELEVGFVAPSGQPGDVAPPNVSIDTVKQTNDKNAPSFTNSNLTHERVADPVYQSLRGIAIGAINTAVIKAATFAAGGAATAAVDVDGSVNVINMKTHATINADVQMYSGGDVVLAAGADLQRLGITGAAALAGGGAGAVGADVSLITMDTRADIEGTYTEIRAGAAGDLLVNAQAQESILTISGGIAASVGAGFGASTAVLKIDNTTFAGVRDGGGTLYAGGNIQISAADDTEVAQISGDVAIGGGARGGAAVVTIISKYTEARIGVGTTVDAMAHNTNTMDVLNNQVQADNAGFQTKAAQGLAIQATSTENVSAIAVAGAAGFYAGAAAGATYTVIDSGTYANIFDDALVNQAVGASAQQSVSVNASNRAQAFTIGGGLGLGNVGIGAGLDLGKVHNEVDAQIRKANVAAQDTVDVYAMALTDVTSYALSAGLGTYGVDGSVSIWNLGTGMDSSYTDGIDSADALNFKGGSGSTATSAADTQSQRTDVVNLLNRYTSGDGNGNGLIADALHGSASDIGSASATQSVQAAFNDTSTAGVAALVGANVINTHNLNVSASSRVTTDQVAGAASVGATGAIGGAVSILNRGDTVFASLSGETINATGATTVNGLSASQIDGHAIAGALGTVALGGQVVKVVDLSSVSATVGLHAEVQTGSLDVNASTNSGISALAGGIDLGGVAGGAGIADVRVLGSTSATITALSVVAGSGVSVAATALITPTADAYAIAGGLLSAVGNVAIIDVEPTVTAAYAGGGGSLKAGGNLAITASTTVTGKATTWIYSEGVLADAGASVSDATAKTTTHAFIGGGIQVQAHTVTIEANANETLTSDATANVGDSLVGGGEGAIAKATIVNDTQAYVAGTVTAEKDVLVHARHSQAAPVATAHGSVLGGAVAVGFSRANAYLDSNVLAYIDGVVKSTAGDVRLLAIEGDNGNGGAPLPTGPQARSTSSLGSYAGADEFQTRSQVVHVAVVKAFIGNPDIDTPSSAQVTANQTLNVTALSWTLSQQDAQMGHNEALIANGQASTSATVDKITEAYVGTGAGAVSDWLLQIYAQSSEYDQSAASGYDGQGLSATGAAHTEVRLTRATNVAIAGTVRGASVDLTAESTTGTLGGNLQDNQGQGNYNTTFHASAAGAKATPSSTFTLGLDSGGNGAGSGTDIEITGTVTSSGNLNLSAHAKYDITLNAFAWVTAGVGSTLGAQSLVTTEDTVGVNFGDSGTATAAGQATLHAGFDGSQVSLLTKLHYSENAKPVDASTNATTALGGEVQLRDNDYQNGLTAAGIGATVIGMPAPEVQWAFTSSDDNKNETWGSHKLVGGNTIDTGNSWPGDVLARMQEAPLRLGVADPMSVSVGIPMVQHPVEPAQGVYGAAIPKSSPGEHRVPVIAWDAPKSERSDAPQQAPSQAKGWVQAFVNHKDAGAEKANPTRNMRIVLDKR